MATNSFSLKVSSQPLRDLADRIDGITTRAEIRLGAVAAVNAVIKRADASIRAGENAGTNLTDAYVKSKTDVALAFDKPSARIVTKGDLTIMGHYAPFQRRVAGTPLRAGPTAGRRPSGVTFEIIKGKVEVEGQWFLMRLRRGSTSGDKVGVFVRTGKGTVKHIYGPSPYSLARFQINAQDDAINNDLEQTVLTEVSKRVEGAL